MRRVRRARREVHEERLVGHERLLLAHPLDRLVGHVLGEVVALLRRRLGLDRRRALVDGRVVLVRLAADEAVEVLEAAAAGRPGVERAHRARLPDRHLVALAELRRRVAVQQQRLRQRRAGVGTDRAVAGRRGGELGDDAHPDRVVVAPGQQRRPRRRAERRRVEAVVLQAVPGQPLGRRRRARPAERARRGEADVVEQDDEHVRARPPAAAAARSAGTPRPDPSRRTEASPANGRSGIGRTSRELSSVIARLLLAPRERLGLIASKSPMGRAIAQRSRRCRYKHRLVGCAILQCP